MNALELLEQDHQKVSELFVQVDAAEDDEEKRQLFEGISNELTIHTHIEETVFYPALEKREELKDLVLEAYEEHKQVKTLLREISNLVDGSEKFDAKLQVLMENVDHHVEEEESEMFPQVEQFFGATELEARGRELEAAKRGAKSEGHPTSSGSGR